MAEHHSGSFSVNTQVNPKELHKAIIIRSGKELRLTDEVRDVVGES